MASLESLPNELLDRIIADLSSRDAIELSMTCKRFRAVAVPTAYHSITLEWTNATTPDQTVSQPPPPHKLLRTLIEKPEYVKLIKSLQFRATGCLSYQDDGGLRVNIPSSHDKIEDEERLLFENTIDLLRLPEIQQWKGSLTDTSKPHVFMALIIVTCTHLESLSVSSDFLMQSDWFTTLIDLSLSTTTSTNDPVWLSRLPCLRVTSDAEGNIWGEEFGGLQTIFLRLFYLPNIQTLELTAFSDADSEGNYWRSSEGASGPWPLDEPPLANKLTTLRLVRSSINWNTIGDLLKQTPNLHTFELHCILHPWSMSYQLNELRGELQYVCSTLTHLVLKCEFWQKVDEYHIPEEAMEVYGNLGPLKQFTALTSLTVSLHVLFGYDNSWEDRFPTLGSFLPPRLQSLTITDDFYMCYNFQQYFDDLAAMKIFRTYLSGEDVGEGGPWGPDPDYPPGGNHWRGRKPYSQLTWVTVREPEWKVATPELREFVHDLRGAGHKSIGFWTVEQNRESLKKVCEDQGIECRVLWTEDDC